MMFAEVMEYLLSMCPEKERQKYSDYTSRYYSLFDFINPILQLHTSKSIFLPSKDSWESDYIFRSTRNLFSADFVVVL